MTHLITVVLVEPQDDINIGNTIRAAKNFNVESVRLVRPKSADPDRILVSAPRAIDTIEKIEIHDSIEEAVASCKNVYALSARPRYGEWRCLSPTEAANEVVGLPDDVAVGFVFGREDRGLTNAQLDLCDTIVTVPTNPEYSSLNLGQAVLLQLWEVARCRLNDVEPTTPPDIESERMERLFRQIDSSLERVGFYKYGDGEHVMRAWRHILRSASLHEREYAIVFGVFKEIEAFLVRAGIDDVDR